MPPTIYLTKPVKRTIFNVFAPERAKGAKIQAGVVDIGGAGALKTSGRVIGTIIKAVPNVGKFVKGVVTTTALTGVIAAGGLALIPKLFKGAKEGTKILLGEEPVTKENIKEVATAAGIGGAAGIIGGLVTIIPDIARKGKAAVETLPDRPGSDLDPGFEGLPGSPGTIITPATQEIPSSRRRKAKKRAKEPLRQIISQRVAVHVGVNAGNRKYIKMRHYN